MAEKKETYNLYGIISEKIKEGTEKVNRLLKLF